jgi:polyferredoxin
MGKLEQPNLIGWSSLAEQAGSKPKRLRPRTIAYGGLLAGIAATAATLMVARAPFDAAVQRAPGSLFVLDADGYVRNTYLLRVTNKTSSTSPVHFHVEVKGLPSEDVMVQDVELATTESRTFPMIIRMKASADLPRTIPLVVRISSPSQAVTVDATFKTEGHLGTE